MGRSLWPPGTGAAEPVLETPIATRSAWLEIQLGQLRRNLAAIGEFARSQNPKPPGLLFVVKDDGFGHGAADVAKTALSSGVSHLAVAAVGEGIELREAGIDAPILVFGQRRVSELKDCLRYDLSVCVNDLGVPEQLSKLAGMLHPQATVHLKVNTGMNRYGASPEDALTLAAEIARLPGIKLGGVFSHFAMSDAADPAFSMEQLAKFRSVLTALEGCGLRPPLAHLCNSGGFLNFPKAHFDMVRLGLLPLGWFPSSHVPHIAGISPILSLKCHVASVRSISAGETAGYGRRFKAEGPCRIAILPVGYGDGYPRLVNTGHVLIRGRKAPIRSGVTMDAIMADVTEIPDAAGGDEAVLLGSQGPEAISAHEVAGWAGTVSYDVLVGLSRRLDRRVMR